MKQGNGETPNKKLKTDRVFLIFFPFFKLWFPKQENAVSEASYPEALVKRTCAGSCVLKSPWSLLNYLANWFLLILGNTVTAIFAIKCTAHSK